MLTQEEKEKIDALSHEELARKWRFDPLGDDYWQGEKGDYAKNRLFIHFGGFTKGMSQRIGWDELK